MNTRLGPGISDAASLVFILQIAGLLHALMFGDPPYNVASHTAVS